VKLAASATRPVVLNKQIFLSLTTMKILLISILFISNFISIYSTRPNNVLANEVSNQKNLEIAKTSVVEIITAEPGRKKILMGSGVIISKKVLNEELNQNDINAKKYNYEYTVVSNRHVITPQRNEYSIRINGETRKILDLYATRESSLYDLSLLKFSSNQDLPIIHKSEESISSGTTFSVNGWFEKNSRYRENELIHLDGVSKSHENEFYLYYTKNNTIEETRDGMSGGALISSDGKLIGIHARKDRGIPVNTVLRFYQSYLQQYREDIRSQCFVTLKKKCKLSFIEMPISSRK
jgi:Trypsin-like peptidase domain